jgi:outer membrane protein assembly factor BamB
LLKGHITAPEVRWRVFLGATETLMRATFGTGGRGVYPLPDTGVSSDYQGELSRWKQVPRQINSMSKAGRFLPGREGLQKLVFDSTQGQGHASGSGRLLVQEGSAWKELWTSPPIPDLQVPNTIVGDFDGAGRPEVAVMAWYDLWVLDLATGTLKAKGRYTPPGAETGRGYGWIGAFDLDGSGKRAFVILADFENHIEVLGWKHGKLERVWSRLIEPGITRKKTVLHSGVAPVQDIDADGVYELVFSVFDERNDGKWHTLVLDSRTGHTRWDWPDEYLVGVLDVDGDGHKELFSRRTRGFDIPSDAGLLIRSVRDGQPMVRWQLPRGEFQTQPVNSLPDNVNSSSPHELFALVAGPPRTDAKPLFFTREASGADTTISAWQADNNGDIRRIGTASGPGLEALAVRAEGDGGVLLRSATSAANGSGRITSSDAAIAVLAGRSMAAPLSTPVVARLNPGAAPVIVVQDATEHLIALQSTEPSRAPSPIWSFPGRGMTTGDLHDAGGVPYAGVLLAELRGDGSVATIAASSSPSGQARLVALGPAGEQLWYHDFSGIPGAPPVWNEGGLTLWFAGHFRDRKHEDVLVCVRRSTMHTDECYLLDGRTGGEVWHRTEGAHSGKTVRECGGSWMAVFDYDGDGLDDALCLYPDVVYVLRGRDGELLLDRSTANDIFPGARVFYGIPVEADFRGPSLLYGASTYVLSLLDLRGEPRWSDGPGNLTPAVLPAIGDFNGTGELELLSAGHHGEGEAAQQSEMRCYAAATGEIKWRMSLPGDAFGPNNHRSASSPLVPASGDINGDGRDEGVFSIGNTLYAVAASPDGTHGTVLWSLAFAQRLGPPIIADASGSGEAMILLVSSDGFLYGVR